MSVPSELGDPAGQTDAPLTSYSSRSANPLTTLKDLVNLVRAYGGEQSERVTRAIRHLERMERLVAEHSGMELRNQRMLDVGAGQRLVQMRYFAARGNDVVGIDRDLVVQGFDPAGYLRMARTNGVMRLVKTLGRKALRVDARFAGELYRQLGVRASGPRLDVRQMDSSRLEFPDGSFDFVYCTAVLMHLERPDLALAEMVRAVRPDGVVFADLIPFTAPTGSLDVRMLGGRSTELPPWAHLRAAYADRIQPNAYLNRLPLSAWRELFERTMPGCAIVLDRAESDLDAADVERARAEGDLLDHDPEDLLISGISAIWRKPTA